MSKLYLTDRSAIELMRTDAFPRPGDPYAPYDIPLHDAACSIGEIQDLLLSSAPLGMLARPLHLLVPAARQRLRSRLAVGRVLPKKLAGPYLVSVDEHCSCICPELLFVLMGSRLSPAERAQLGMELCGSYALAPSDAREASPTYNLTPLTSVSSIESFLDMNPKLYGAKPARNALRLIADKAASPMETALYLLLSLPEELGGYGLPAPELNPGIDITAYLESTRMSDTRYGDLVYRAHRVILEYQSWAFHAYKREADEDRRDDMQAAGYTVMFITPERIQDFHRFEAVVGRLAHHLEIPHGSVPFGMTESRLTLRKLLLPSSWTTSDYLLVQK